jgi:hypothetical protein
VGLYSNLRVQRLMFIWVFSGISLGLLGSQQAALAHGSSEQSGADCELALDAFAEIWEDHDSSVRSNCPFAAFTLLKQLQAAKIDVSRLNVLLIFGGSPDPEKLKPQLSVIRNREHQAVYWTFHVAVENQGRIMDLDYPQNHVPSVREYLQSMFTDFSIQYSSIKYIPALEYLEGMRQPEELKKAVRRIRREGTRRQLIVSKDPKLAFDHTDFPAFPLIGLYPELWIPHGVIR